METQEYSKAVNRTAKSCETREVDGADLDLLHWSLGLAGESGELVDAVKKYIFYRQEFDVVNVVEELGDILFYVSAVCETIGVSMDYVMLTNKEKLERRYPEGYSNEDAKERKDKQTEAFIEAVERTLED